jgi:transcriptional regulator with XRE-family HTH domain
MAEKRKAKKQVARKKVAKKKATRKKKKATKKKREKPMDRATQMSEMRSEGYTFEDIAKEFNVSRQRVHQLVSGAELAAASSKKTKATSNGGPNAELLRGRGIQEKIRQYEVADTDPAAAEIGDRIVYCRLKRGMTIGQLAQESSVPYGVLSTYENNKAQPSCESLRKLCVALRVSAHWIIFGQPFKRASA